MNIVKKIAKNIRKQKDCQKTSFIKIARKARIPFTTLETILYKERYDLKVSTLMAIAKALKISLDELTR